MRDTQAPSSPLGSRKSRLSRSIRFGAAIAVLAGAGAALLSWQRVNDEYHVGLDDLERRASLLAHRIAPLAMTALSAPDADVDSMLGDRLGGHSRLLGFAVFRPDGRMLACAPAVSEYWPLLTDIVSSSIEANTERTDVRRTSAGTTHFFASPLLAADGAPRGAIVVVHDALYLEDRVTRGAVRGILSTVAVSIVFFFLTSGVAWAVFERPLHQLAEWMRRLRLGNTPDSPPRGIPVRMLADESTHLAASFRAARSKEWDEAQGIVRSERAWTRDRLRSTAMVALGGQQLVVVSNREPYMHQLRNGVPEVVRPASGLVTGLDPVLRACGGLWVAHGSGDADRRTADASGCVPVPPEAPRYTLRRVWLSKEEEEGYYYGFSNEGLWPLCHLTHERPVFRASDWDQYVRANRRFADAVLEELGSHSAVVMVQDYQLALVPGMLKAARPDLRVGLFWHIPWPNAEAFRICPYRVEILHGMLGADLVGFHLQQHCNNFLDAVDRMVEARLDWDRCAAELKGHVALVRPFPISVQSWSERGVAMGDELARTIARFRHLHRLGTARVGVGVDRIDYTKGIAERFRALDRLFEKCPEHRGTFTFVQLGAPSRTHIPRYRDLLVELETIADAINWKYQTDDWKPIHFLVAHHDSETVHAFLSMASVCVVSSLHDGMNLVAKEYVAAQAELSPDVATGLTADGQDGGGDSGGAGVLVLSEFAGAARDLPESILINPYDTEEFAEAIKLALAMEPRERRQRMTRMRLRVEENNIYRWAADFLAAITESDGAAGRDVGERAARS